LGLEDFGDSRHGTNPRRKFGSFCAAIRSLPTRRARGGRRMSEWTFVVEPVMAGRGARCRLRQDGARVTRLEALGLVESSSAFRDALGRTIVASPYVALRWETPPITVDTLDREFEFVLVDDPFLEMAPEPHVFASWFDDVAPEVLAMAVPNLGRT